ncbi:MAG: hypothetical protein HY661_14350 [Betaproteobacteria bacterium]|nr:hypothetical protein [Betaproteobacteria bacterium]
MMTAKNLACGLFASILLAFDNGAGAQQFTGQVVTMIVNYSSGGPTDIDARIVARHLPKHLQGVNSVIVRNVGGGGGNIGVNQLGEAPSKDRLNIGFFTWDPLDQLTQNPNLHVRYNDLKFIAGFQQGSLIYIRRDAAPGIRQSADVAKAQPFRVGALAPTSHATFRMRLALDLLGAKYEIIPGYKGLKDIEVAVRQGDIQLTHNSFSGWYGSVIPTLVNTGIVIPVLQYDHNRVDGTLSRSPDAPDVPAFLEVYKDVWGKEAMPRGEKWQALQLIGQIMDSMGRTVFMPPNAPAAAVEEMRRAFEALAKDPAYIADYEKVVKFKPRFIVGAEGERIIAGLGTVSPSFVSFLRQYLGQYLGEKK